MPEPERMMWGIHAKRAGAHVLFLEQNHIAIGWPDAGNLGDVGSSREDYKTHAAECYPDKKKGAYANIAGQWYRFVRVMKEGDYVVFPSSEDRKVHIGVVEGDYRYDSSAHPGYPNVRSARWLRHVPRTTFSNGALHEIGAAMTLFQINRYTDEFLTVITGEQPSLDSSDDTVGVMRENIEEITSDFILKQLARELKGHALAHLVAHLLETMGYRTRLSPPGPDGGVDIIAHKDELGFEPPIIKVQVKSEEGNSSIGDVQQLFGTLAQGEFGMFVTLGGFTKTAMAQGANKQNVRLIDGAALTDLILHHYEQLDSKYKGLIPLKRVYIPDDTDDSDAEGA